MVYKHLLKPYLKLIEMGKFTEWVESLPSLRSSQSLCEELNKLLSAILMHSCPQLGLGN